MSDAFNDPEFLQALASMGVAHKPGMAADLMRELAPLLAAEGIDLDHLDDTNIETLNAALARATERYNFELFTPVGHRRTLAVTVLRDYTKAIAVWDLEEARAILDSVGPEPTKDHPAISDVIGAGVGLLDTWFTEPGFRTPREIAVPEWHKPTRAAAIEIMQAAGLGQAFDSLDSLMIHHGGLQVYEGTVLAVAVVALGVVASRGGDVDGVLKELLPEAGPALPLTARFQGNRSTTSAKAKPGRSAKKGRHASGNPANSDLTKKDRATLHDFVLWLREQPDLAAVAAEEAEVLRSLFTMARGMQINPQNPDGVADLANFVEDMGPTNPDLVLSGLSILGDYVQYRVELEPDDDWAEVQEDIALALHSTHMEHEFETAIAAADQIDPEERRHAFASTPIVAMVPRLLKWIGFGRQVTPSGGLRRADIAEVAAMLGVSAIGVNRMPPEEPHQEPLLSGEPIDRTPVVHAMSMYDVPVLSSWWQALWVSDVIDLDSGKVRPGPIADEWADGALPTLEQAANLLCLFVSAVITGGRTPLVGGDDDVIALTIARLALAIVPDSELQLGAPPAKALVSKVMVKLRQLEQAGLVELDQAGSVYVQPAFRGVIAHGLSVTIAVLDAEL